MGILRLMKKIADKSIGEAGELPEAKYPVPDDLLEEFNIGYKGRDGNALTADIYRQKDGGDQQEKRPVVIIIHGGGLFAGRPVMERGAAEAFARKGYLVFVPSYRMLTEADACGEIADICSGFDFAGSRLEEYGGDPERIFVVAESAGAYLALYASAMIRSKKLCDVIACEPPHINIRAISFISGMFYVTRRDFIGLSYPREIFKERSVDTEFMKYMDPECSEVISALPPAILTTSRNDFLRKYTISYAEALAANGKEYKLVYYAEKNKALIHAFPSIHPDLPESVDVHKKIDRWFREH